MAVFRVEKTRDFTVMSNHHLRNKKLSLKAKGLLSLMLSLPDDWDYTTKGLARICKDGVDSIGTALNEIERHGYLTRCRLRDANGRLGDIEYTIHERPIEKKSVQDTPTPKQPKTKTAAPPKRDFPEQVKPEQEKPEQGKPEQENPAQLNIDLLITDSSNTQLSIINPSINPAQEPEPPPNDRETIDRIDTPEQYRKFIKDNIEYDHLRQQYSKDRLDEVVELILEIVLSKRQLIRIAKDELPREVVKSRLLKITSCHVEYVFDCLDKNTSKVSNIKAYLLTALYNAPATMDSFYRVAVNHDLYGGNT